eukprot:4677286-Pyramimonas_sp.AAC.1
MQGNVHPRAFGALLDDRVDSQGRLYPQEVRQPRSGVLRGLVHDGPAGHAVDPAQLHGGMNLGGGVCPSVKEQDVAHSVTAEH